MGLKMSRWLKVVLGVMALFYSIFGMSMETEQAKRSRHFNFLNSCILKKESLVLIKLSELQKKIEKVNKTQKIENDNAITPLISPIMTFDLFRSIAIQYSNSNSNLENLFIIDSKRNLCLQDYILNYLKLNNLNTSTLANEIHFIVIQKEKENNFKNDLSWTYASGERVYLFTTPHPKNSINSLDLNESLKLAETFDKMILHEYFLKYDIVANIGTGLLDKFFNTRFDLDINPQSCIEYEKFDDNSLQKKLCRLYRMDINLTLDQLGTLNSPIARWALADYRSRILTESLRKGQSIESIIGRDKLISCSSIIEKYDYDSVNMYAIGYEELSFMRLLSWVVHYLFLRPELYKKITETRSFKINIKSLDWGGLCQILKTPIEVDGDLGTITSDGPCNTCASGGGS